MNIRCLPHDYKRAVLLLMQDDEVIKEIHTSIFGKNPRFVAKGSLSISEQLLSWEKKCVRNFVLRRLAKKGYTSFELKKILKERLVSASSIEEVVSEMERLGAIDDKEWVLGFIRGKSKSSGTKSIIYKLKNIGIPEEMAAPLLAQEESERPQGERIRYLLERKFRKYDLTQAKEKQKAIASLLRRGFDYEEIVSELKKPKTHT